MVSPGIAIGKAFRYIEDKYVVPQYDIPLGQIEFELERFFVAVEFATNEINELKKRSINDISSEELQVLDSQILMINDPEFQKQVDVKLREDQKNVEWIFLQLIETMIGRLNSSADSYLRDRTIDINDIAQRILGHLLFKERHSLQSIDEEIILVAHNLMPSDTIAMNRKKVLGIAIDAGGKTSHTAILARSFEIPAVLGLSEITRHVQGGEEILVDGNSGTVIIHPDEETKKRYIARQQEWLHYELQLQDLNVLPAETTDGKLISLEANIEMPDEIDSVLSHGVDGIGLYRSEFLFLNPDLYPSEEDQFRAYRLVIDAMGEKSVTIRTLDVGGDKVIPGFTTDKEPNPILGWRAIRFCLSRIDIFKIQLRAILRASLYGNVKVMFPMISSVEELDKALEVLKSVEHELDAEGVAFRRNVPVGIMIEIPSAAFTSDILARKVSFFSIGTNDLIQYTIAVDRGNEKIAYLYEPFHPGVLRLIKLVIDNGHKHGIPVGMCGEMAGEPMATIVLLGLGLDEFSMSAISVPEIKKIVRSVSIAEAEQFVGIIMEMNSYQDIENYLDGWMKERFSGIFQRDY